MTCEEILRYRNENNSFASFLGITTLEMKEGYARGEMKLEKHHKLSLIHIWLEAIS